MRKIFIIIILSLAGLIVEFALFNSFFRWLRPNFSVILIVFFNLYWGSKYGFITAVISGILRDSCGLTNFGLNTLSFVIASLAVSLSKKYFYHIGSEASRVPMVWAVSIVNVFIQYMINLMFNSYDFGVVFVRIMLPEVLITGLAAFYVIREIRKIVVRFSY